MHRNKVMSVVLLEMKQFTVWRKSKRKLYKIEHVLFMKHLLAVFKPSVWKPHDFRHRSGV